jgi:hypothetical protein
VLAAAITGHADAIVTWSEKDFPSEVLDPFGIEIQTPDEFVLNQLMLEKLTALAALKRMRERWVRPQYDAIALVALLEKRGCPRLRRTCAMLWHSSSWLGRSARPWRYVIWRCVKGITSAPMRSLSR